MLEKIKNIFKKKVVGVEPLVMPQQPKFMLTIYNLDGSTETFTNTEPQYLYKIYMWFLIRQTPKYNIIYNIGQVTILRDQVKRMRFTKKLSA
jgi:hypothetical protein